jgi:serine/threonine protein kinase
VRDHTEPVLRKEKHLTIPSIGVQRPTVRERYDGAFAPILVVDFGAVLGGNRTGTHSMNFSISDKVDLPIVNLIQIMVYNYEKEGKYSCNTLKVQKRNWSINTVIMPTCYAPAQAHSAGIYHLDLKPDNILYTRSDRAQIKITDWGLGRDIGRKSIALTASVGQIGGTPGYCAPEQWFMFDVLDGRADIYSLGVIFYEMMTGRRPPLYDQRDRWAIYRIISSDMILLIPILRIPLSPFLLVCILAAICIAQIVIDLKQHPYHRRRRVLK